jgi:hypothetical protein
MREMFDSVNWGAIPRAAVMVAGYANGRYANYVALKRRFPRAVVLGISVRGTDLHGLAHVLDIENGDATPAEFHPWAVSMADQLVHRPTAYIEASRAHEIVALAPAGSVPDLWLADWTGEPHELTVPGAHVVAVQFAAPGAGSPGDYDLTAVYDDSWHPAD